MKRARTVGAVVGLVVLLTAAACAGEDEPSAQEQFCDATAALSDVVSALADLDVLGAGLADGLDGVRERFETIRVGVDAVQETGLAVAADEIDSLEASVDELDVALSSFGEDPTLDAAGTAFDQLAVVASDAAAVFEVYGDTCE